MEYPVKTISQLQPFLRGFRKQAGHTQAHMAQLLNVSQPRYAKLEAQPELVSFDQLMKVFQLLNVELILKSTAPPSSAPLSPAEPSSRLYRSESDKDLW